MAGLKQTDPEVYKLIQEELHRQQSGLELIASENFVSEAVLEAQGSVLTNKYAEGLPGKRYYGGCEFVDGVERLAIERIKKLFDAPHANVQPHSGAQANMAVFYAMLQPGDTILGMALDQGGHLTHGSPVAMSGKWFKATHYGVGENGHIDYDNVLKIAKEVKPKLIICGASNYPRIIDFAAFRKIADEVGAYLMADIAHIAGLIAAGLHPNAFPHAHFVTTTTHKTLRGPRGGVVMCHEEFATAIDKAIFPGLQGGPLEHVIAAKAVAFHEALQPEFKIYQKSIVENAKALAKTLIDNGLAIVSGGTDNHLMTVDLRPIEGMTGKKAQELLEHVNITTNKNSIPNDPQKPLITSGIRIGTPAVTSRGLRVDDMKIVGECIADRLKHPEDQGVTERTLKRVAELCKKYPLYADRLVATK